MKFNFFTQDIGWISRLDIALFTKNLAVMLKSGLTITESLEISIEQTSGKLKRILKKVLLHISEGNTLAESLSNYPRHFSNFYVNVVQLGETGGSLEENLNHLSLQIEKQISLRNKIKTASIYPIFILLSTFILGVVLATFVIPRLSKLFSSLSMGLPWPTRVILSIANFFQHYSIWALVGIVAFIIFFYWLKSLRFIKPAWHYLLLSIPLVGNIMKIYNLAQITRNLSVLLKSGMPINDSLSAIVKSLQNETYKRALKNLVTQIESGDSLASVLKDHKNIFPTMVIKMVNVGEKSGQLEDILMYLANFYEEEVDNATKNLSSVIEPLLLIAIGLIVGFVGLSIIMPIYQITGSVSSL